MVPTYWAWYPFVFSYFHLLFSSFCLCLFVFLGIVTEVEISFVARAPCGANHFVHRAQAAPPIKSEKGYVVKWIDLFYYINLLDYTNIPYETYIYLENLLFVATNYREHTLANIYFLLQTWASTQIFTNTPGQGVGDPPPGLSEGFSK